MDLHLLPQLPQALRQVHHQVQVPLHQPPHHRQVQLRIPAIDLQERHIRATALLQAVIRAIDLDVKNAEKAGSSLPKIIFFI